MKHSNTSDVSLEAFTSSSAVRKPRLALFLLLYIFHVNTFSSSSGNSEPDFETALRDIAYLDYLMELKISSGSFLDLSVEKSPASITVINREMIKRSGARNISELLEIFVPGFQYSFNKWNGTLWGMRGVANDRNTKIIYLVNGHKLNTQARDGFQSETVLGFLDDIERVEVLRGPAGIVYGSGAIGGIINVVTRKSDSNEADMSLSAGYHNSRTFQANIFGNIDSKHIVSFSLGYRQSNGLPTHQSRIYGRAQWPYPNWLDDKVSIKNGVPSDGNFGSTDGNWKIAASWETGNFSLYARATRQKENAGGWFIIDPWPQLKNHRPTDSLCGSGIVDGQTVRFDDPFWSNGIESYGANLHQYISDNVMVEASYQVPVGVDKLIIKAGIDGNTTRVGTEKRERYKYQSEFHQYINNGDTVQYWDMLHPVKNLNYTEETFGEKRFTFNSTYHLNSIPKLQLAAGIEYRLDLIGEDLTGKNQRWEISTYPVISNIVYNTFSLFSEGFYDLSEKVGFHLGGRLDFHTRAIMANPKIAFVFSPNQHHSIKVMYQTSSNNGSADNYEYNKFHYNESGSVVSDFSFVKPDQRPDSNSEIIMIPASSDLHSLKPEKNRSVEVSSHHKINDQISIIPSLAIGQVTDLFAWSQDFFRVVNVGEYGYLNAEFETKIETKFIKAGASHTFQRPVFTDIDKQKGIFVRPKVISYDSVFDSEIGTYKYTPVVSDDTYDTIPINVVKDGISDDGENFLNLSTNVTKLYLTIFPLRWMSIHTNLRLFWGLQGRKSIYEKDPGFDYLNITDSRKDLGLVEYLKKSVSKKLNISLNFDLPSNFELSFFAFDVLGIDQPDSRCDRNYRINTIRWQHMSLPDQKELYSTDQRTFELKITKFF